MATEDKSELSAFEIDQIGRRGQLQDALNIALRAIREGNRDDELFYVAARTAFQLGDLHKSEQLVKYLLASDPDHINGWVLFGEIYSRKGDIPRSSYGLKRAEELFPALVELNILNQRLETIIAKVANGDIADRPGKTSSFETATFADICFKQGYLNKALKIYSDLLEQHPEDESIRRRVDEIKKKMGNYD